jgi:hypothetical protein
VRRLWPSTHASDSADRLLAAQAEQLADHGGGCDLHQHHVIEADFVE